MSALWTPNDPTRKGPIPRNRHDVIWTQEQADIMLAAMLEHMGVRNAISEKLLYDVTGVRDGRVWRAFRHELLWQHIEPACGNDQGIFIAEYASEIERVNARLRAHAQGELEAATLRDWFRQYLQPAPQTGLFD